MESVDPSPGDGEEMTNYLLSVHLGSPYNFWKARTVKQKLYQSGVGRTAERENQVLYCWNSGGVVQSELDELVSDSREARAGGEDVGDVFISVCTGGRE